MNAALLYQQAVRFHTQGALGQAEQLYLQIIQTHQDSFSARHALGVLRLQQDRTTEALQLIASALQINPHAAEALSNYGLALHALGRFDEALASFDSALAVMPGLAESWVSRGVTLNALKRHPEALASLDRALAIRMDFDALNHRGETLWAMGLLKDSLASYDQALAISPDNAQALNNRGITLFGLKRHDEALASYNRALALDPDYADALNNRGTALLELHRPVEALESYGKALAMDPANAGIWKNYGKVLFECDRLDEGLAAYRRAAELEPGGEPQPGELPHKAQHDREQQEYLMAAVTGDGRPDHGARMPTPAVNAAGAEDVTARWHQSQEQLVVIDDLLSAEALGALRHYCLQSNVWRKAYEGGYLGAFPEHGFACPLLGQISQELREKYPAIFGAHHLRGLWAFKYDSALNGIDVHADEAAVNVNFWITPDAANLDPQSGGLVVWDVAAPLDWDFERYNCDSDAAREFLLRNGAKSTTIPYRANRAVIFDSDLFHKTDRIVFKGGYQNRRINVTLLFGNRESARNAAPGA